jgi:hypothetical protein
VDHRIRPDGRPTTPDGGLDAPAFHRNHQAIWAVLEQFLNGRSGDVLEAGSGTGQHVVFSPGKALTSPGGRAISATRI